MRRLFNERRGIKTALFVALMFTVFGLIVMGLWNLILAEVLHVSTITFWQALGILALSKILFGFGGANWGRHKWRNDGGEKRREMWEKFQKMTPEERKAFKENWRGRCRERIANIDEPTNTPQQEI